MIENLTWNILPPRGFYFRVSFFRLKTGVIFNTSFSEVSGLGWNSESVPHIDSEGKRQEMPVWLKCNRITLKSPLQPLPSLFEAWVNGLFNRTGPATGKTYMETYDMLVTLQSQERIPVAAWLCSHAYPVSQSVDGLDAEKSGMVMERVVLACNRIERKL